MVCIKPLVLGIRSCMHSLYVLGFVRSESDHAIYCRGSQTERLVAGVYLDDLVITGSSFSSIKKFKLQLAEMFKMSDLGLLSYYMGIEVKQGDKGITLGQGNYAKRFSRKEVWQIVTLCSTNGV
jgi:hypothetical protein